MPFLGVDVGGSKSCSAWWPEDPGDAAAIGPGVQVAVLGVDAAVPRLLHVLRAAAGERRVDGCVVAAAGAGARATCERLALGLAAAGIAFPLAVVGDVLAAAAAALAGGPGVLVWSGTGSFAVARRRDGGLVRVGGRGYLLGDRGSAYDFVRRAAVAALLAVDDLGPPTELAPRLTRAFGAESPARLGAALQRLEPAAVAAKAGDVFATAEAGDEVALEVVADGVEALAALAFAAARQAELDWPDLPVAFGGGVLAGVPGVADALGERLRSRGSAPFALVAADAAARGAARLAAAQCTPRDPLAAWVEVHGAL